MTKSRERGENEITKEAWREATRTGRPICAILAGMLRKAKEVNDNARQKKIVKAQKYEGCRNVRMRRKK